MDTNQRRAACAGLQGLKVGFSQWNDDLGCEADVYVDKDGHEVCCVSDYHPDLPESIEQANELWKKIDDTYHWSIENDPVGNKHFCIMDKKYNTKMSGYDILAIGKGPTWNSAFTEAVAELHIEREKK